MGLSQFFMQVMMTEKALKVLPPEQQELYANVPTWLNVVFAIAVFSGVLGCAGLILKKAWAVPLLILSLITVCIQSGYNVFMTNAATVFGPSTYIMTAVLIGFASLLVFYASKAKANGWIS